MGEKIVVGPITKGLRNDVTPFNVDNDAFPILINAYQWRQRIKRKRGTEKVGRLTRYFDSNDTQFNPGTATQVLSGGGAGNLLTGFTSSGIQSTAQIVPGSVTIHDNTTATDYTDPSIDGTLSPGGTINYATGAFTITPAAADTVRARFNYYPDLPVLGLENFVADASDFPGLLGFDQTYGYNISINSPYTIHSVSFYWNPPTASYNAITYTQKTSWTPVKWNLATYQQVWSTNYQGSFWVTGGIPAPYAATNIGMQFKPCATVVYVSATQLTITITEGSASLVIGDWVFINEVTGTNNATVNFQTGFVTASANAAGTTTLTVRFPYATISNQVYAAGILQYLTSNSDTTKDCLRWYNGSPISSAIPPVFSTSGGWVNFCPPLLSGPTTTFSVSDLPPSQYYLVGARMVVPFKDRLLFFGPVVQTSTSSPVYLQDTVIYSQNGTPYYTCSFTGDPLSAATAFTPLLVPTNQTGTAPAFFEDVFGYGGFISAGYARPITSVSVNEDALIVGFADRQARLLYTGNDIVPFNFYIINSELGSDSTFSSITLDRGVLTVGGRGIIITSQTASSRIDLPIPDQVFQIKLTDEGSRRVCAQRDFINEWIYFTYAANEQSYVFPNQTLQYNYRDETWALFNECYTTYGTWRRRTGYTWATWPFLTWASWSEPWDWGDATLLQPQVIAGNQQGYVMARNDATGEGNSLYISGINSSSVVTSTNHCLNEGDYIVINGVLGTIGQYVNGLIFSVANPTTNTFTLNPTVTSGTYLGAGEIKRMYVPYIQTKQFPVAWAMGRKTRLGPQQYLFSRTTNGQVTLLIFLSQDSANPYNNLEFPNPVEIVPSLTSLNNSLIYSTVLYTCPESTNLGLTAANINLQTPTSGTQNQIWHRMNTSLIGDTVQIGFTLNDDQMRDTTFSNQFVEIELHGMILDVQQSQLLS